MKTIIAIVAIVFLMVAHVDAGSKKYTSRGAGQSKRPAQTIMERQQYADWLKAGCPPLIQAPQPSQQPPINTPNRKIAGK